MNHPVLHFLCGENAAVGSAALTAHRAVIHSRLTLRVMSPDRFADRAQPEVVWIKPREKNKSTLLRAFVSLAGGGFEPPDLRVMSPTSYQTALLRDILGNGIKWCRRPGSNRYEI